MSGIVGGAGSKSGIIGETEIEYEEGTWTPKDTDGNGSNQYGMYTRIGNLVTLYFSFSTAAATGTTSNLFYITNFPFTVGATDGHRGVISIGYTTCSDYPKTGNVGNQSTQGYLMHAVSDIATKAEIGACVLTGSVSYHIEAG